MCFCSRLIQTSTRLNRANVAADAASQRPNGFWILDFGFWIGDGGPGESGPGPPGGFWTADFGFGIEGEGTRGSGTGPPSPLPTAYCLLPTDSSLTTDD